jgi:hypothetical protein
LSLHPEKSIQENLQTVAMRHITAAVKQQSADSSVYLLRVIAV